MNTTKSKSKEKNITNHFFTPENVAQDSIWVVLLFISGLFKIPSLIPGTEFQLSAPLAVSIGRIRGFLHYLTIGIVASIIGISLGLQTIYNVIIAMVYIKKGNQSSFLNLLCRSFNDVNTDHLF